MFSTGPMATAKFRERTFKDRSPGISFASFRCKKCNVPKSVQGRKRVSGNIKDGWMCAHCYEVREAKRAAKKAMLNGLPSGKE